MAAEDACPDSQVYDRLGRLERDGAVERLRWKQQDERNRDLDRDIDVLCTSVTRLSTTIKVATAILGFLLALAGVVLPLMKG